MLLSTQRDAHSTAETSLAQTNSAEIRWVQPNRTITTQVLRMNDGILPVAPPVLSRAFQALHHPLRRIYINTLPLQR